MRKNKDPANPYAVIRRSGLCFDARRPSGSQAPFLKGKTSANDLVTVYKSFPLPYTPEPVFLSSSQKPGNPVFLFFFALHSRFLMRFRSFLQFLHGSRRWDKGFCGKSGHPHDRWNRRRMAAPYTKRVLWRGIIPPFPSSFRRAKGN